MRMFIIIIGLLQSSYSQSIINDVKNIINYSTVSELKGGQIKIKAKNEYKTKLLKIFIKYTGKDSLKTDDLKTHYNTIVRNSKPIDKNPFIEIDIASFRDNTDKDKKIGKPDDKLSKSFSGLNVTTIVDGLAKFIVKRAKGELTTLFFERFKEWLDENKNLQNLFPQTFLLLTAIDDDIYRYNAFLQSLHESFKMDISALYRNLPKYLKTMEYLKKPEHEYLKNLLETGFLIVNGFHSGDHPGKILNSLAKSSGITGLTKDTIQSKNIGNALRLLNIISQSLRSDKKNKNYWVDEKIIETLFQNDKTVLKIYLGLLYQKSKMDGIKFHTSENDLYFYEFLSQFSENSNRAQELIDVIKNIYGTLKKVEEKIVELNQLVKSKKASFADYYNYFTSFNELIEKTELFEKFLAPKKVIPYQQAINEFAYFYDLGKNLYNDVKHKNYAAAVINLVLICDTLKVFEQDDYKNLKKKLLKYGSFIATLAKAESSDQVSEAIEAVALPSGSWRMKRDKVDNGCGYFTINSYLGISHYFNLKENFSINNNAKTGIFSPIGFEYGWAIGKKWSFGLFASIIDVGALSSLRFTDSSKKIEGDVKFGDIFSPGLHLLFGSPWNLTSGIGYKMLPKLYEVDAQGKLQSRDNRIGDLHFFIAVDIPLFTLY